MEDIIDLWWSCERGAALSAALRAALAVGEVGFVLLDRRGVVIEFNPRAAQLLKRGNGLKACDGRLVAELDEDDARLRTAVVAATVAAGCGQMIEPVHLTVHRDGSRPLTVAVSVPYRQPAIHADDSDAVVLLQIADPDADTATVAESCAIYDFTPSETRLCDQIVAGFSVNDAAATLGISVATARTYLKRVFAKTGVHRQADLVRLIIKSRVPTRRWRNSKISRLRTFKEASMPLEHFTLQKPSPLIVSDAEQDSQLAMQFEAVRQT
ncbi:MAG: helix-turn-helix transcriptional regulator [Bradyrhizobium sp.]